uniref:Uncharacterized protein n=1 Tax=Pithovirus LCPAC304 TaxID=2506594 RepID=A0A481Z8E8_9VIRU|nr:MAG: hypothetical protein LCPAC304_05300 [Pithovirus LCPAC304]
MGHTKKKCGCCCQPPRVKRLPYATISDKNADDELGSLFSISPVTETILWSAATQPSGNTCLNGPLTTWFNTSTGIFTIQESGLYQVQFMGKLQPDPSISGTVTVTILRSLRDATKRCANSNLNPTNTDDFSSFVNGSTSVSGTLPLVVGDTLAFQTQIIGFSGTAQAFFEINVVQLSRADIGKIEF